jgi:hypothetical protein
MEWSDHVIRRWRERTLRLELTDDEVRAELSVRLYDGIVTREPRPRVRPGAAAFLHSDGWQRTRCCPLNRAPDRP